jgi:hypothetical protein
MIRHEDTSPEGLRKAFEYINSFGYDSCMLTYHSRENDMFIKLARAVDPDLPLKYIIAMRTYAISPEYLGLMIKGFEEIAKDKIMFNIVAGDLHANETSLKDLVDSSFLSTSQDRVRYTGLWLEKFTNLKILNGRLPKMFMSGTSKSTFDNCKNFNGGIMVMVDYYMENLELLSKFDTRCVSLQICIRDTDEEADWEKHENYDGDKLKWCYFYSEKTLLEKIMELKRNGVTDIMVTGLPLDPQVQRVHEFIKKNLEVFNG